MINRIGIILDFDDTLVETTIQFYQAQDEFATEMERIGCAKDEVISVLEKLDIENVVKSGGFYKHCFPKAMGDTYQYFCSITNQKVCNNFKTKLENIGWQVFDKEPVDIPGAKDVVKELAKEFPLFLVTKGDKDNQLKRVKQKGFYEYFKRVYVVSNKKDKELSNIIKENDLDAGRSWMIGNSMKSDINPAIKQGIKGIHVVHPHTWFFEEEEPVGDFIEVNDIRKVVPVIMGEK